MSIIMGVEEVKVDRSVVTGISSHTDEVKLQQFGWDHLAADVTPDCVLTMDLLDWQCCSNCPILETAVQPTLGLTGRWCWPRSASRGVLRCLACCDDLRAAPSRRSKPFAGILRQPSAIFYAGYPDRKGIERRGRLHPSFWTRSLRRAVVKGDDYALFHLTPLIGHNHYEGFYGKQTDF